MNTGHVAVVVRRPGQPERRVSVGLGVAHLGRAEDNDIVLTDIGVSRRHARLVVQESGVTIEDLGSGNGTYFRGSRVNRQPVRDGDEFLIDPFRLVIEIEAIEPMAADGLTGDLEEVDDDDTAEIPIGPSGLPLSAEADGPQVRLVTLQGQRLAPSYLLRDGGLSIGRSEARDIILFDPAASRNHATIESFGGDIWFRDQGSGNGSFVNGHRVREQCLRDGDRVRVGSTEFRVEVVAPANAVTPGVPGAPIRRRRREEPTPAPVPAPPIPALRTHPSALQGPKLVAVAAAGGFAIVFMMILGGLLAMYVLERSGSDSSANGAAVAAAVSPEFAAAMSEGRSLFDGGDFLQAASKFYTAQLMEPNSDAAKRMGAVACEHVVLDELNKGVRLRGLSEADKQTRRSQAFADARRALRGRGEATDAIAALRDVQAFDPDNDRARELIEALKAQ